MLKLMNAKVITLQNKMQSFVESKENLLREI